MSDGHLRAIDLYSGAGGWSLGLRMAGIEVVASYEWWDEANKTNHANTAHPVHTADIRELSLSDLPENIQVVVGSPPCTEFSFSNRGGGGDIKDGLRDVIKFLTIVEHLKPRWWVMENVPRVAAIVEKELGKRGRLARFRHLAMKSAVVNMEDYGVPQRRRRCLIGNIDFDLLAMYSRGLQACTLGDVVHALEQDPVNDPLFGVSLSRSDLRDHEIEPFLDAEERRINETGKTAHPVYNAMPFPDPLNRTVRTITATCTRVSRESVVIEPPGHENAYRRLSLRERACLQGFPITYQFYGTTYGQKLRMIGNAVPPAFSFRVAQAILGIAPTQLPGLSDAISAFIPPTIAPPATPPENYGRKFPASRTFRFAIPNLRLKSGVRFEMVNAIYGGQTAWAVKFYFGTSKEICEIRLSHELSADLVAGLGPVIAAKVEAELSELNAFLARADLQRMQAVWSHRGPGGTRPFEVLDRIGAAGATVISLLEQDPSGRSVEAINDALAAQYGAEAPDLPGVAKLHRNATLIHAGLIVGGAANKAFVNSMGPRSEPRSDRVVLERKAQPLLKAART